MIHLFKYTDFRKYLNNWLSEQPGGGRGLISKLAGEAKVQPAYLSRVLLGNAQLNLDQAYLLQTTLGHSSQEVDYFMLLVEYDRAAHKDLRAYLLKKIKAAQKQNDELQSRFHLSEETLLTNEQQLIYYSSYQYAAIHTCISLPKLQTLEAIEKFLKIPAEQILEVLEFLLSVGLAIKEEGKWKVGKNRIHLRKDSSMIRHHHSNWRVEAIKSLDRGLNLKNKNQDLHYSGVVSLSVEDAKDLREFWLKTLESFAEKIGPSPEETVRVLTLDFFSMGD